MGILYRCLSTGQQRRQPQRFIVNNRLDDVDCMFLWGEVNNDPFYRGK